MTTNQINQINQNEQEDLLTKESDRLTIEPIENRDVWDMYKLHESTHWRAEDIKFNEDRNDWKKLTDDERYFIKHILAFFASSDLIVNENLASRFSREIKMLEAKIFYQFQIAMENIHCVSPDTNILTDTGYYQISHMENKTVNVWNGTEFSEVVIRMTNGRKPNRLYKIHLSNGAVIDATDGHEWIVENNTKVQTKELYAGIKLAQYRMPIIHAGHPLEHAYERGQEAAIKHLDKNQVSINTDDIPLNANMQGKITWLGGYLDTHISQNLGDQMHECWDIMLDKELFPVLQRMLLFFDTLGLSLRISCHTTSSVVNSSYIRIDNATMLHLKSIGLITRIIKAKTINLTNTCTSQEPIQILKIEDLNRLSLTYCFIEPKKNNGVFNGILTGQSETYSKFITSYIDDPKERDHLFNAVRTIPCVTKKANWAHRWIESSAVLAERLLAFACVEGVFFSGAFCCIFWLSSRGIMPAFAKANEYISRDEGIHTNFACLLYKKYIKNKLTHERFAEIMMDAVKIEIEFITEALPCKLIGMNSGLMGDYIKYVTNRLAKQMGHVELFPAIKKCPFEFMDRIALRNKQNFFEDEVTEYAKGGVSEKSYEDIIKSALDDIEYE